MSCVLRNAGWSALGAYLRLRAAAAMVGTRLRDTAGQTAFEYVLIGAGIAILVGAAVMTFGGAVKNGINLASTCVANASSSASGGTPTGVC